MNHNRIVTPSTEPDRWTPEEKSLFEKGLCSWVVEFGNGRGIIHCRERSKRGASFGYCSVHEEDLLECHWPDGSPRR